jgi:hypothetical protein
MHYFYDIGNPYHNNSYFIGKICYVDKNDILEFFSKEKIAEHLGYDNLSFIINSFLIKRQEYDCEEEVRLIFQCPNNAKSDYSRMKDKCDLTSDYYPFTVDINNVIEEIVFHPAMCQHCFTAYKAELIKLGFTGKIFLSDLYEKPIMVTKL